MRATKASLVRQQKSMETMIQDLTLTRDQLQAELHEKDKTIWSHVETIRILSAPIPMRLNCPECGNLHVDENEFETKPHHTHACQHCGNVWRPAIVNTVGVRFLPGFKNEN